MLYTLSISWTYKENEIADIHEHEILLYGPLVLRGGIKRSDPGIPGVLWRIRHKGSQVAPDFWKDAFPAFTGHCIRDWRKGPRPWGSGRGGYRTVQGIRIQKVGVDVRGERIIVMWDEDFPGIDEGASGGQGELERYPEERCLIGLPVHREEDNNLE